MSSFHIHIADDDADLRTGLRITLREMFGRISESATPQMVMTALGQEIPDVLLLDLNFARGRTDGGEGVDLLRQIHRQWPDLPVVILTAWGGVELAVDCMKAGTADFVTKPWDNLRLQATLLAALRAGMLKKQAGNALQREKHMSGTYAAEGLLVAESLPMKKLLEQAARVALTDATVLITGENGTGKGLLASRIHELSGRSGRPFVEAGMGTQPPELFDDYLFGHEPGAYTDAREPRPGLFELADGGTLFIDEVADLPLQLQSRLLTALSSGRVTRLGSNREIDTDVRVIAASHASVPVMVAEGRFREDLYYRLNTVELHIPPLRERTADIPALLGFFNRLYAGRYNKTQLALSATLVKRLAAHRWPGNVRELAHAVERAVVLSDNGKVDLSVFIPSDTSLAPANGHRLSDSERETIVRALKATGGNIVAAARLLGIGRTTLYRKMEKYGL